MLRLNATAEYLFNALKVGLSVCNVWVCVLLFVGEVLTFLYHGDDQKSLKTKLQYLYKENQPCFLKKRQYIEG